jgi:hypothetical protein
MSNETEILQLLQQISKQADRIQSPQEKAVAAKFLLGRASLGEYLLAKSKAPKPSH